MLTFTLRFPLGTYHALSAAGRGAQRAPEWPPSPVRVVGALLAACHETHRGPGSPDPATLRAVEALDAAIAPWIDAPTAAPVTEFTDYLRNGCAPAPVAALQGPSRWAPRNPEASELDGLSMRDLAGPRAPVSKGGIAIGGLAVRMHWTDVDPDAAGRKAIENLAAAVPWLGTSRSPVLIQVEWPGQLPPLAEEDRARGVVRWRPLGTAESDHGATRLSVRVPDGRTIAEFDEAFERRRSTKGKVEKSGLQRPANAGTSIDYVDDAAVMSQAPLDPQHWGDWIVLEVSPESATLPRATATYEVARAVRAALLAQFDHEGTPGEAPELLRGRGAQPHVAIQPLAFVGSDHADGLIKGVAVILPHPARLQGDLTPVADLERALGALVDEAALSDEPGPRGPRIRLDRRETAWLALREQAIGRSPLWTLDVSRYTVASRCWTTVTPVVHGNWRSAKSDQAQWRQICADCAHVGLPEPVEAVALRNSRFHGAPTRVADRESVRPEWRTSLDGPTHHLALRFAEPVRGPVILGRARHLGLGLMLPLTDGEWTGNSR